MLLAITGWMTLVSLLTAMLYFLDKRAARLRRRRIPEKTLLIAALLGGWPGGLIAGQWLRHKTQKASYRMAFAAASLVNSAIVIGLIYQLVV